MPMSVNHSSGHGALVARGLLLIAAGAVALFNGSLWSPFFDSVAYILHLATRGYPFATPQRLFYVTPVAIAVMTLLVAGIPAAIYERIRSRTSGIVSTDTATIIGRNSAATNFVMKPSTKYAQTASA